MKNTKNVNNKSDMILKIALSSFGGDKYLAKLPTVVELNCTFTVPCLYVQAVFLLKNQISKIHPKAFRNMNNLKILHLSYNLLPRVPENLPTSIQSLRLHDNQISTIQKGAFKGMQQLNVLGRSFIRST